MSCSRPRSVQDSNSKYQDEPPAPRTSRIAGSIQLYDTLDFEFPWEVALMQPIVQLHAQRSTCTSLFSPSSAQSVGISPGLPQCIPIWNTYPRRLFIEHNKGRSDRFRLELIGGKFYQFCLHQFGRPGSPSHDIGQKSSARAISQPISSPEAWMQRGKLR